MNLSDNLSYVPSIFPIILPGILNIKTSYCLEPFSSTPPHINIIFSSYWIDIQDVFSFIVEFILTTYHFWSAGFNCKSNFSMKFVPKAYMMKDFSCVEGLTLTNLHRPKFFPLLFKVLIILQAFSYTKYASQVSSRFPLSSSPAIARIMAFSAIVTIEWCILGVCSLQPISDSSPFRVSIL